MTISTMTRMITLALVACSLAGCAMMDPIFERGGEELAKEIFDAPQISMNETHILVDAAWRDLTSQTSTSGEWGNPGLAIAPVRRGATNAEAPQGIEGNIQTEVERLADADPTYTAKSSTWLIQQLRGAGATNIEAILQPDRREQLRGYLRTAEVGIQYILIPTMRVTFFEENNRYVYSLTLERVDIESEHGDTVRGRGEVTAGS